MLNPVKLKDLNEQNILKIINRNKFNIEKHRDAVQAILKEVREKGDQALIKYTKIYDKIEISEKNLKVTDSEITKAYRKLPRSLIRIIKTAAKNIKEIHRKQLPIDKILKKAEGINISELFKPLRSIGLYVPGGTASYPSTALMLGIPARVAGVKKLIACTPPSPSSDIDPATLVALDIAGVEEIYRIGGVQAIGALAYGTDKIPKVDKIVGPGNIYVTTAKMLVYSDVGIDFIAGPSEIVIFADDTANPSYIAADMISQAEHDTCSVPILITTSEKLALTVRNKIFMIKPNKTRRTIIEESFKNNGHILISSNETEAANFINRFAPEHLEIISSNSKKILSLIYNAGSISVGEYTPIPITDYALGVNHVLPTSGSAAYNSGLTVYDFLKIVHVERLSRRGLQKIKKIALEFAKIEGLAAHADSINERFIVR